MATTMSDIQEALGGAVGIILGGYILIMSANAINVQSPLNLPAWGGLFILAGIVIAVVAVAALFAKILGELP